MTFYDDEDTVRAILYRLFSGLFLSEPTEEFLIQFRDIFGITITDTIDEITIDFMQLFKEFISNDSEEFGMEESIE